jgi:hypothetical protein
MFDPAHDILTMEFLRWFLCIVLMVFFTETITDHLKKQDEELNSLRCELYSLGDELQQVEGELVVARKDIARLDDDTKKREYSTNNPGPLSPEY